MNQYPTYKPSGIDWIGNIPAHWEVKKLKSEVSLNDDVLPETTDEDFEIEYIEISGVQSQKGIVKTEILKFKEAPSQAKRLVKHGDGHNSSYGIVLDLWLLFWPLFRTLEQRTTFLFLRLFMTNAARYTALIQGKKTDQVRGYLDSHNISYKTKPHTGEADKPLFVVFSDDSVLMITIPPTNLWEDEEIFGTYTAFSNEAEIDLIEAE